MISISFINANPEPAEDTRPQIWCQHTMWYASVALSLAFYKSDDDDDD